MPIYSYRCSDCGAVADQYSPVADRNKNIPDCHGPMTRQLSVAFIGVQAEVCAESPIDGTVLTSRRQRSEYMKRNGLQEAVPAAEVIRKGAQRKAQIQADAKALPKLPVHLEKQLLQEAGFPG